MPSPFETDDEVFSSLLSNDSNEEVESDQTTSESAETTAGEELIDTNINEQQESRESTDLSESETEKDFLMSFLNEYGVENGKITYENEDGSTEEVNFNDLDSKEKLNILKEITTPNLSKDEIDTINYLRKNNATIQDVVEYYSQKAVDEYIKKNGAVEKQYAIDDYSDDELYIADLKSKFEDMSEEDLKADLEIAKENEELFKKKVDIIRKQYKQKEEEDEKERAKQQEDQYNTFRDSVKNKLVDFNEISMDYKDTKSNRLQIEDSEKEEIYRYILNQDENGATQFFKDLNDPSKLVKMAWFALYGEDAISDITNYWKSQLKSTRQKSDQKSQTTVIPSDVKTKKDHFINHHKYVETSFGDELL